MATMQPEIAALLIPISPEDPAGINLEYEQIYNDIRQARESDPDYLPQDEWTIAEPLRADWHKVRSLSVAALSEQSKDLQIGCWLVEAMTHLQGIEGTETGFHFLSEFITHFWFHCWRMKTARRSATANSAGSIGISVRRYIPSRCFVSRSRRWHIGIKCWPSNIKFAHGRSRGTT